MVRSSGGWGTCGACARAHQPLNLDRVVLALLLVAHLGRLSFKCCSLVLSTYFVANIVPASCLPRENRTRSERRISREKWKKILDFD